VFRVLRVRSRELARQHGERRGDCIPGRRESQDRCVVRHGIGSWTGDEVDEAVSPNGVGAALLRHRKICPIRRRFATAAHDSAAACAGTAVPRLTKL
jgi:hypothetical protein